MKFQLPWTSTLRRFLVAPEDVSELMDYTGLPEGVRVEGRLANGVPTDATARCLKCGRVGLMSLEHGGGRTIVHRGFTHGDILEAVEFCKTNGEKN